ncbi:hypothetical protein BN7_5329 [Wickerhamomyces ciferrii]|uniref:Damage-regulated import facilitator 1 n=1 Tax=Wickerhamomyces ciferrii (strain ATCC 14091 / BCRC 22168 / CBS 111 / JCM 3599 / NBRC 0793 / NRRL Y-1031 F-60-10) TaxID=1206466 RepID=K0KXF2_WICCF|nr:uncharacterized protein BN7_5329 [Wickerhamomyces ciferrii]CCH45743.1 hypothetical protein BN7_5329 [Wickerhamomyces ciferrii]
MSQVKRQLNHTLQSSEQYPHQEALKVVPTRIRYFVNQGYQNQPQLQSQQPIPEYKKPLRVPLPSDIVKPPMLSENTSSFGSSLDEWESNLEERLQYIDEKMGNDKSFGQVGVKRGFESVEF